MTAASRTTALSPVSAFDIDAVARVTGLSTRQLQRWDRNGFFEPAFADPNRRRPGSRIYSRDDVIALRIIAELREHGVPFAEIGSLLPRLAPDKNGNVPIHQLYVIGNRVYFSKDEADNAKRGGRGESTIVDVDMLVSELNQAIEQLQERRPEEIGRVVRHRGIMGGVPIIAGTRIPTEFIAWYNGHGYSMDWILREFPRLMPADVRAAVDFESQREARSITPVLVRR